MDKRALDKILLGLLDQFWVETKDYSREGLKEFRLRLHCSRRIYDGLYSIHVRRDDKTSSKLLKKILNKLDEMNAEIENRLQNDENL